jgi:hypothetical protein
LARALALQHGWEWLAISVEAERDSSSGLSDWRERSRKMLEAVHRAMVIQIDKEFGRRARKQVPFAQGRRRR